MTTFWREGHYRNSSWVDGHFVTRGDWDKTQSSNLHAPKRYRIDQTSFSNFTIPNAICPICGEGVFYYENSSGSKVWFDELGPPWLIHGCFEKNNSSSTYIKSPIQNQKEINVPQASAKLLSLDSGILSLNRLQQKDTSPTSKIPCIIQKNIKRSPRSYITVKIFDVCKKEKTIFLMLDTFDISNRNHICFMQKHDLNNCEIFYFDIEKSEAGSIKATAFQNRKIFLFLAKYRQQNSTNLEKIKVYSEKVKILSHVEKVELAHWLYDNTMFSRSLLSIFSGLYPSQIKKIENDELKPWRIPESPVFCKLIDEEAFSLLISSAKCIHTVI